MPVRKKEEDVGFVIIKFYGKKKRKIKKEKKYRLPKHASCIHVYAGMLSFGNTKNGLNAEMLKTNKGKFFKKPDSAVHVSFPFYFDDKNFDYGEPVFGV